MTESFDPLVPRLIDAPTEVPLAPAADLSPLDDAKIFAAPARANERGAWRQALHRWRQEARHRLDYDGSRYDLPQARWAADCYAVAQVWLWDELFFDHAQQRFTPERFLADARARFGGLDGIVLWHAYPIIGIDERNQWDFYQNVPELAAVVEQLHQAGVAVFVDYNPWDVGTRRGADDVAELTSLVGDLGVDGVFLDTLKTAEPTLVQALDKVRPGIGLEGESKLATSRIGEHALSWAQWFADSDVPGVLRARWFERRHMQHHVRRWHRNHGEELRSAWLNGVGVMVWEVVFGVWVGWTPQDASTLAQMLPVQRAFGRWLREGEWTPLADIGPEPERAGVYCSTFDLDGVLLACVANTGTQQWSGAPAARGPGRWLAVHEGPLPAGGVGAWLHLAPEADTPAEFARARSELQSVQVSDSGEFAHRRAVRRPPPRSTGAPRAQTVTVADGCYVLTVRYRNRETGMYDGAPFVNEWKPLAPRLHDLRTLERAVTLSSAVAVMAREVSAGEFAEVLGHPQPGDPDAPHTSVTLEQAREYARLVGGRLPTEDEWQLAATQPGFKRSDPQVWNWTESEHSDGRTRFVMLKGGMAYCADGSDWYVEGGVQSPEYALKFLLPGLGQDASSTIGFRVCWEVSS
ncbi:MAG: SUMF1/EgtB/PvdO family nonheme iron enzyme [Beutenbergiaceae bacterium]